MLICLQGVYNELFYFYIGVMLEVEVLKAIDVSFSHLHPNSWNFVERN